QRVLLPLSGEEADPAARACFDECRASHRLAERYAECLAKCPGARVDTGKRCPRRRNDAACVERIVATSRPAPPESSADHTALIVIGGVIVVVVALATIGALCDEYSSDPDCSDKVGD